MRPAGELFTLPPAPDELAEARARSEAEQALRRRAAAAWQVVPPRYREPIPELLKRFERKSAQPWGKRMLGKVREARAVAALLQGPTGCGKSTAAAILVRRALGDFEASGGVRSACATDLMWIRAARLAVAERQHAIGAGEADPLVRSKCAGLLVLDDLGLEERGAILPVLQDRYDLGLPTILSDQLGGSAQADIIYGGGGDDVITGLAGADDLSGEAGADVLNGGTGVDSLRGGAGGDTYLVDTASDLAFEASGAGTDLVIASAGYYLWANIENLTLASGAGSIFGVGNELDNVLTGNEGQNLLIAGAGIDLLNGGAGNDSLFGQDGIDTLNGEAGIDYLVGGEGDDALSGGNEADAIYGEGGDDVIDGGSTFSTDIMVGGDGNDVIDGDSGLGDFDMMDGAAGNDTYLVDTPDDLTFEADGGGTDTVIADITGAGYYLYPFVENLTLIDQTPFGVGNDLANVLTGSAIGNYLLGGAGDDTLNGKAGNDVLFGEGGADTFIFEAGTGGDVIGDFQVGADKIDLRDFGVTFADVSARMVQDGNVMGIVLDGGDVIILHSVQTSQLTASDFILA